MKKRTLKRLSLCKETVYELSELILPKVNGGTYTQDLAPTCKKQPPPPSVTPCPA